MTTAVIPEQAKPNHVAAVLLESLWPLRLEQYHQMIHTGILTEDDPVEFLQGLLVRKMPKNPAHSAKTRRTRDVLQQQLPPGWFVDSQEPITLADSEPEPDVVVIRGEKSQYEDRHPRPEDVALVVEVAGATLERDSTLKKRIYAAAAIPIYWIVNLQENQVEVFSEPTGPASEPDYRQQQIYQPGEEITLSLPGQNERRIAVDEILPGRSEPRL